MAALNTLCLLNSRAQRQTEPLILATTGQKQSNLSVEMSEVGDCDGIIHKTKRKESYGQLTLAEQSCGGIRGRRTGVDEK